MKNTTADGLSEAALKGDIKQIQTLLTKPLSSKSLHLALGHAAKNGDAQAVNLLLKAGADPDSKAVSNSLLIEAAEEGELEVVKLLVEAGAEIHRKVAGSDAFAAALEMNQVKVAEYLKRQGADWATSTLLFASEHGDLAQVRKAVAAGANLEAHAGILEETPLMLAAHRDHPHVVRYLLQKGADPNRRVNEFFALFLAAGYGKKLETVDALLEGGANLHAKYGDKTVLMAAAQEGCLPIVKRLIELGADIHARDKEHGNSVMDCARSSKSKELIAYLKSLGVTADRDAPRTLIRALAREYGGKPVEHIAGFMLNAKFNGLKCQFGTSTEGFHLFVYGLDFGESEFKRGRDAQLIFSKTRPDFQRQKVERVSEAGSDLRYLVFRTLGISVLPVPFVISFCRKRRGLLEQMELSEKETLRLGVNFAAFSCPHLDINLARPRLDALARLIQGISRPPQPERSLFAGEWLLKPATRSAASAHFFGGRLEQRVGCPHCGDASNLMAQVDLSDPALPKTGLGRGKLPVFWCLACLEWDAAFFDVSGPVPIPLHTGSKKLKPPKLASDEADLPKRSFKLVPVPAEKKAGRKSKLGGTPGWIQLDQTPDCPRCAKSMAFVLQLASDSRISYCDMGMLYAFACPECRITASLIQSH